MNPARASQTPLPSWALMPTLSVPAELILDFAMLKRTMSKTKVSSAAVVPMEANQVAVLLLENSRKCDTTPKMNASPASPAETGWAIPRAYVSHLMRLGGWTGGGRQKGSIVVSASAHGHGSSPVRYPK